MVSHLLGLPPINRIEVVGRVITDPVEKTLTWTDRKTGENKPLTCLSFALQHYNYKEGKGLRIWVDTYANYAMWLLSTAKLSKGDALWIEGKLVSRQNKKGHFYCIKAQRVHFVPELPRAVREGDQYLIPAEPYDRLMASLDENQMPTITPVEFDRLMDEIEEGRVEIKPPPVGKPWDDRI